jgi:hypothetical protein
VSATWLAPVLCAVLLGSAAGSAAKSQPSTNEPAWRQAICRTVDCSRPATPLCEGEIFVQMCDSIWRAPLAAPKGSRAYRVFVNWVETGGFKILTLSVRRDGAGLLSDSFDTAHLSASDVSEFEAALTASGFDSTPMFDTREVTGCIDGVEVDIESLVDGRYHGASRRCGSVDYRKPADVLIALAGSKGLTYGGPGLVAVRSAQK